MPRGGRMRSPSPSRGFSSRAPVPAARPPMAPMAPPMAQPRQPGMMAQMATTAAGVAVGSAVGHTIGHAMTGGGGGGQEAAPAPVQGGYDQGYGQQPMQQQQGVCQLELKQFLECASNQSDLSLCYGFNEALRQCKVSNGLQM